MTPLQMTDAQLLETIRETTREIRVLEAENPNRWSNAEIARQSQISRQRISRRESLVPLLREAVTRGLEGLPADVGVAGVDPDQDILDLISLAAYSVRTRGFGGDKQILHALEELAATRRAVRRQQLTGEDELREYREWSANVDPNVHPYIAGLRAGFALRGEPKS